ncbi:hypothetical protein C8Q70DRAFT_329984 [Cubamyces menziesii]|uniref:EF-hand domain-containing protein n=1 Tax=Trametes cubensis TaxID=1111947 RepID=A0AAD7TMH6_9APHY|nr:hypothetical protein C8Q70DRAFT_329984 [Cubamyces menziesii]KAJ8469674.1 hypothetical protein ONZ51_g8824 [Trametes cubensis]
MASSNEDIQISNKLDDAYQHMQSAQLYVSKAPNSMSVDLVNKADDFYNAMQAKATTAQNILAAVQPVYESDAMKTIRDGMNTLVEGLPGVLKALDEVANIHPFIKIAVGAFKVVVELDLKRRDNEKKITLLFVEMKDMMEVLIQLRLIKDEEEPGPDGTTIKARMQELVKRTADDIKTCANACDAYSKKKLLVKVLKSSSWDDKFKGFLTLFTDRRKAFTFALEMHVGKGVDDANRKLDSVNTKLNLVLEFFATLVPPDQQQLGELINSRGGPDAVMKENDVLTALAKYKPSSEVGSAKRADAHADLRSNKDPEGSLKELKEELFESADVAMQKNLETFERKFDVQRKKIIEEMQGIVRHEGDRVIDSVLSGPHDKIRDTDIHELWKDMRWRGHAKARHFVLALRDYYSSEFVSTSGVSGPVPRVIAEDQWALKYLDVEYISALIEAFDEDASGFITISEVNQFTTSRPQGWSVVHWLAYWAQGWQMSCTYYIVKITNCFAEIFALEPHVRAENHTFVAEYLMNVWRPVTTLSASMSTFAVEDELWSRFESYVLAEEKRLDDALKDVHYYIDAVETLYLITGPGRIEQFIFPLLYLLVRRHLDVMRLCYRRVVINRGELWYAAGGIYYIMDMVMARVGYLESLFKQRNLDPDKQFKTFAYGLYNYIRDQDQFWSLKSLMNGSFTTADFRPDEVEKDLPEPGDVLSYPTPMEGLFSRPEEILTESDLEVSGPLKVILGRWYGFFGEGDAWPGYPMVTFFFHASEDASVAKARSITAGGVSFAIVGQHALKDDGTVEYSFSQTFSGGYEPRHLKARLSDDGQSLFGLWGNKEDDLKDEFYLTRLPPELLTARPSPREFRENKIQALWRYAIDATREQIRRKSTSLSWIRIKEYLARRNKYLTLIAREEDQGLNPDEYKELAILDHGFTYDEACCCFVLLEMRNRAGDKVPNFGCNVCAQEIEGVRYTCLPCSLAQNTSVDFCDKPGCRDATLDIDGSTHLPSHHMIKVRTFLFYDRDTPKLFGNATRVIADLTEQAKKMGTRPKLPAADARNDQGQDGDTGLVDGASGALQAKDSVDAETPVTSPIDIKKDEPETRGRATAASANKVIGVRPTCVSCSAKMEPPFFVCVDCIESIYICTDCDEQLGGLSIGAHTPSHSLLRYSRSSETNRAAGPSEERLRALESKVASFSGQFTALNERMHRMEGLLESLLSRLVPEVSVG